MFMDKQPVVLTDDIFKNPPSAFRGTPFWAWNCVIKKEDLAKQIGYFKEMGMGGFHIHCRTGMSTEYLSDEFMDYVSECNEIAKKENLLCWLYDEDRYASGFGGGYVTKDINYRERYLIFCPNKPEGYYLNSKTAFEEAVKNGEEPRGYFVSAYRVVLENGFLKEYEKLTDLPKDEEHLWWVYLEISETSSWWNNQSYVNTLDKKAIDRFIEVTHERYYAVLGNDFSKSIPAIFTDEPQFAPKEHLNYANERKRIVLPFTDDFTESYLNKYGSDILDFLPELVWQLPDSGISVTRYRYHDHLTDRFVEAYAKNISVWCEKHNIAMTGHMKGEENLYTQTISVGEVMRSLRHFHIPGHDVLCDQRDYATAKQAQSVAHQYNRYGAMSELYGVTNWDFTFKGHKMSGDWQAALGIAVRVHHLAWMSMKGEAKRDYPASINYQSPWYQQYNLIEDHFARVNTAITRGIPHVRIGVFHPIESYWMHFGPYEQTYINRDALENNYKNIVNWLLFGLLDYDFISEALMEEQTEEKQECIVTLEGVPYFKAGVMKYEVVIIPGCHTLRKNTVLLLNEFISAGGKVIFLGDIPYCVDGCPSEEVKVLAQQGTRLPFENTHLLKEMETYREVDIHGEDGGRTDNIFYHMRQDGENRYVFFAHAFEKIRDSFNTMVNSEDYAYLENLQIRLRGIWKVTVYDTMTGSKYPVETEYAEDHTMFHYELSVHESLLLLLEPGKAEKEKVQKITRKSNTIEIYQRIIEPVKVTFEEPNVFLLDNAEYRLDEEEWNPCEDLLKLDNICRNKLGYPPKEEAGAQPWTYEEKDEKPNRLSLKFLVESDLETEVMLALESLEDTTIFINGTKIISPAVKGWYVDEAIQSISIPKLIKGINEIVMEIPYGISSNIEAGYLLGDFGVSVIGKYKKITKAPEKIVFGDITRQGMPFYGGNITYHCKINVTGGVYAIKAQYFTNPLLKVALDEEELGAIAFAPYTISLGNLLPGEHDLTITAYGNRYNTFGQLHNCDKRYSWFGSSSWRTVGDRWSDEYQLKENGILCTPVLISKK